MTLPIILIVVGIVSLLALGYKILQTVKPKQDDQSLLMLQQYLSKLEEKFEKGMKMQDKTLSESLQKQFATSAKIVKDVADQAKQVTTRLTELQETNKQIVGFATQLKTLENTLRNPKQRGILGEFFLENLLSNVLPPSSFQMQYGFKGGEVVDAIIRVNDKIIPIDAKFSLENYNRIMEEQDDGKRLALHKEFKTDLKKRIDETSKYVRPGEGTTEFAFMFIPADGVFYNLLTHKVGSLEINTVDLIDYAFRQHVIMVSPMTFYAYLQTVMHALRALAIEESAKEIQKRVGDLGRHLNAYQDYFVKIGNHLGTTVNAYNNAGKELEKVDKDVLKITDGKAGGKMDVPVIEGPKPVDEIRIKIKDTPRRLIAETMES
ncbi:MAG: DNA recombination protein RmuC [Candidatus Peregrinibacteria bacterium]